MYFFVLSLHRLLKGFGSPPATSKAKKRAQSQQSKSQSRHLSRLSRRGGAPHHVTRLETKEDAQRRIQARAAQQAELTVLSEDSQSQHSAPYGPRVGSPFSSFLHYFSPDLSFKLCLRAHSQVSCLIMDAVMQSWSTVSFVCHCHILQSRQTGINLSYEVKYWEYTKPLSTQVCRYAHCFNDCRVSHSFFLTTVLLRTLCLVLGFWD